MYEKSRVWRVNSFSLSFLSVHESLSHPCPWKYLVQACISLMYVYKKQTIENLQFVPLQPWSYDYAAMLQKQPAIAHAISATNDGSPSFVCWYCILLQIPTIFDTPLGTETAVCRVIDCVRSTEPDQENNTNKMENTIVLLPPLFNLFYNTDNVFQCVKIIL